MTRAVANAYNPLGRLFDYRPVTRRIDAVLKGLNSVLTIIPEPILWGDPWARDLAALRDDMDIIGLDAWTVIALHENERRRYKGLKPTQTFTSPIICGHPEEN